jgi:hypothetical protein
VVPTDVLKCRRRAHIARFARSQSNIMQVLMMLLSAREFLHRHFVATDSARVRPATKRRIETRLPPTKTLPANIVQV